jgi:hypothetical protein
VLSRLDWVRFKNGADDEPAVTAKNVPADELASYVLAEKRLVLERLPFLAHRAIAAPGRVHLYFDVAANIARDIAVPLGRLDSVAHSAEPPKLVALISFYHGQDPTAEMSRMSTSGIMLR